MTVRVDVQDGHLLALSIEFGNDAARAATVRARRLCENRNVVLGDGGLVSVTGIKNQLRRRKTLYGLARTSTKVLTSVDMV